ncbi:MAG: sulfur-carrier protein adenylyltransferase/sulfurtransferase [Verrucomicrobiota bacterium]
MDDIEQRVAQTELSPEELARYSRHLIMPEVGVEGQRRLKAARVLCIGAGGLGSPAALYLASAGVGTLGIVDPDDVDLTNLHRQILHGTKDIGRSKLESAKHRLHDANPNIDIELHHVRFSSANAEDLVARYDVVVDGSDNFPTRYLSNDVCVWARKPNVYGSVFRFDGQSTVFAPHLGGPCYRCLFPEPPPTGTVPNCAEAGVLGVLPGIIGMIQATEAIKLILGNGEPLVGRLLHFDALKMKFREFNLRRDPQCPVCGEKPAITSPIDYEEFCGGNAKSTGAEAVAAAIPAISVSELKQKIDKKNPVVILDVRENFEYEIARIENSKLIPLDELPDRISELDQNAEIVALCHTGMRSARAVQFLQGRGFTRSFNLEGGIDAWAKQIDPAMQKY